jgi:hypothetical protein
MKKLVIFMIMLSFMMLPVARMMDVAAEELLPIPTAITDAQKAEIVRVKHFVKEFREKLPTETLIITKANFDSTADVIEYLLQAEGWIVSEYSIFGSVVDDENGIYAIYNVYIKLSAFDATFITTATFEWQDTEGEPV